MISDRIGGSLQNNTNAIRVSGLKLQVFWSGENVHVNHLIVVHRHTSIRAMFSAHSLADSKNVMNRAFSRSSGFIAPSAESSVYVIQYFPDE